MYFIDNVKKLDLYWLRNNIFLQGGSPISKLMHEIGSREITIPSSFLLNKRNIIAIIKPYWPKKDFDITKKYENILSCPPNTMQKIKKNFYQRQ